MMAELGITGKRVRKKPKYLRDDEDDSESLPKPKKMKNKRKSKKESKKEKTDEVQKPGIKLKIKFGGKSSSNSLSSLAADIDSSTKDSFAVTEGSDELDIGDAADSVVVTPTLTADVYDEESDMEGYDEYDMDINEDEGMIVPMPSAGDQDDTSEEEREWLEAVESGDIEEYERKKSERNPAILTARQKRLLHGGKEQLVELPSISKGKVLTEEQVDQRKQQAIRRRQLAREKCERAKKQTMDRLLKKSDATVSKGKGASKIAGTALPHMRYRMSKDITILSMPPDVPYPLPTQVARSAPKAVRCGVSGCKNIKKYNCSKTNIPLCSLQCYKKNMSKHTNAKGQLLVSR